MSEKLKINTKNKKTKQSFVSKIIWVFWKKTQDIIEKPESDSLAQKIKADQQRSMEQLISVFWSETQKVIKKPESSLVLRFTDDQKKIIESVKEEMGKIKQWGIDYERTQGFEDIKKAMLLEKNCSVGNPKLHNFFVDLCNDYIKVFNKYYAEALERWVWLVFYTTHAFYEDIFLSDEQRYTVRLLKQEIEKLCEWNDTYIKSKDFLGIDFFKFLNEKKNNLSQTSYLYIANVYKEYYDAYEAYHKKKWWEYIKLFPLETIENSHAELS
jgi:hypothetical protein